MTDDLDALESKLSQLLERWQAMRQENLRLRQQAVSMENANKQLQDRLAEAKDRLESLYNKIPE
jgi:predicted nuclease with TOPRIM domain